MGCRDSFSEANIVTKIAFVVILVSLFCSWIAFTTTSWLVAGTGHYGLWRQCHIISALGVCSAMDGTADVDFGVTQAFAIIGFLCQNVGCLLVIFFIFKESCRGNGEVGMAAAALMVVSAIGWLISVAVFGGKYNDDLSTGELHYSYGLAVVACFLGLIGGVVMFIGSGNGSVGSK